nr:MAG TPA: hypothetical protein [Caudoviricetes sp.]DAZ07933.1 MAG TPA: hypothetical protein [Caudoviricetes sp.]
MSLNLLPKLIVLPPYIEILLQKNGTVNKKPEKLIKTY